MTWELIEPPDPCEESPAMATPTTPVADLVRLTGRTAIVIGGALGIGAAIAGRLAEAGANVVVADVDSVAAKACAGQLQERGLAALAVETDVADEDSCAKQDRETAIGALGWIQESKGMNDILPKEVVDAISTPDTVETRLGRLTFKDGAPSKETAEKIYDNLDLMHGVEAFVNAFQGASTSAIWQGLNSAGIPDNAVLIFSELMDAKSLFLTGNADTVYFWSVLNLTEGPIVVETPPMALGVIDDMWFRWVTDFGMPGPDRGVGGKYLLVPPGYTGELPDSGYNVTRLRTIRALMIGRQFLDDDDPRPSAELIKTTLKIYPYQPGGYGTSIATALGGETPLLRTLEGRLDWSFLGPQPPAKFIEGSGKVMNTIPPSDFSYFETINDLVQQEPPDAPDPEIMGSLAAIGIVKGEPFNPDARMRRILADAAAIGTATGRTLDWCPRESEGFAYYPGSGWINMLFVGGYTFETPPPEVSPDGVVTPYVPSGYRRLNARTSFFFYCTVITPLMCMRLTEIGSQYVGAFVDSEGEYLDGGRTYKVTLPPNIPAARFWSLTVYDNQTRSMLDTPQRYPRAGSQGYPSPAAVADPDGSTTVWFAPSKPPSVNDGNWIQTVPGKGWNTLLRLYSPLAPFFDKTWRPSEIEATK